MECLAFLFPYYRLIVISHLPNIKHNIIINCHFFCIVHIQPSILNFVFIMYSKGIFLCWNFVDMHTFFFVFIFHSMSFIIIINLTLTFCILICNIYVFLMDKPTFPWTKFTFIFIFALAGDCITAITVQKGLNVTTFMARMYI